MSTHKHIDRICVVITALCLLVAVLFLNGEALGIQSASRSMGYETTLFDTSRVHTLEIVIDDWDAFLETCEQEEYSACTVVIDNEAVKNVAIRGKGNTSLSTVKTLGSQRYSFKIEFDHYQSGKNYHGLDKLSLNNIIQDNTYMKDYLSYRLMAAFGVDAPLCSFVYITVNGEDWGLYLAVEGVEDSFLQRSYGKDTGELYKPDSMSFGGGGPGNGKDFNMDDFLNRDTEDGDTEQESGAGMPGFGGGTVPEGFDPSQFTGGDGMPEGFDPSQFSGGDGMPEGFDPSQFTGEADSDSGDGESRRSGRGGFDFGGIFGGMGSGDVKLQYTDDDPDSYSNIFDNAKTDVSQADQTRLIQALKQLNAYENLESVVDVDEVLRYFVVHNYVCNGDSYTGSIVHNYYLHEHDGQLSMIPWDYNLAFGTFQSSDATDTVNDPIDTPMSVSDPDERPMWGWIQSSAEYTALYHQYFQEFLDTVDITGILDEAYALIAEYVQKDPTAFCSYEEFETGVATLRSFCTLRTESIRGQLDGSIPSTDAGQQENSAALVDASALTLSDMGSMGGGMGGGGGFPGGFGSSRGGTDEDGTPAQEGDAAPVPTEDADPASGSPDASFPDQTGGRPQGFPGGAAPGQGGASFPSGGDFSPPGGFGGFGRPGSGDGEQRSGGGSEGANLPSGGSADFPGQTSASASGTDWLLFGVSVAVLVLGLVLALRYRRQR